MSTVKKGDTVRIKYTGLLEDDTIFDQSENGEPLEFQAGSAEILPGVSNGVIGMAVGDKKQILLKPEEAYGPRLSGLEQNVPLEQLPDNVQEGDLLTATVGGDQIILTVTEIKGDTAVLDANHPLAGHTLTFDIELVGFDPV